MIKIKRVLISVHDKTGIATFARELSNLGIEILSTGGTKELLRKENIKVKDISEYTKSPEMLGGRVKTLHPKIHGGILAKRDDENHLKEVRTHGIDFIDMVVVNLYPFEEVIEREGISLEEAIENIDIGGPTMLRAGAKNYCYVVAVSSPEDYPTIIKELKENRRMLSLETSKKLAMKVFERTSSYDIAISNYLKEAFGIKRETFPVLTLKRLERIQTLRYGENPHQKAALYGKLKKLPFEQLQGKELSYNNILDLDAAWTTASDFKEPVVVFIKHNTPCGVASSKLLLDAYKKALSCDPLSAFGSIVGFNRKVSQKVADEVIKTFVEAIIAPDYEKEALKSFQEKKDLRIIRTMETRRNEELEIRNALGCYLFQSKDHFHIGREKMEVVTKKKPSDRIWDNLLFAWKVVKNVKSNAIVLVRDKKTIGIGAGQMSRIDAMKLAVSKACESPKGAILASDAFFPFSDVVEEAHKALITAIIQPGGSKKDNESIDACDRYGISMVFTGERHFRH